ncbi:MAG: hypothetical protein JO290_04215, partial [Sphingomonadaceae bacterium]|nr:hypothetical protein [Sphingomonadaceae bacterium]
MALSTTLPGCTRTRIVAAPPPPPVVVTVKDVAPAELTRCPVPPAGFPAGSVGELSEPARAALVRLA